MIKILSSDVVNQIAAGEVVERPASVLKEVIENSIDAGATEIKVYIKEFGTEKIQIIDNGSGIEKDDLEKVFLKHATSKIAQIDDLNSIQTFGFRGEALASISSVSKVILETKHANDEVGSEVIYEDGKIVAIKPASINKGTNLQILNLFENIPARKKFLKSKDTENKALIDIFNKFILANPQVSFYLDIDGSIKNYPAESLEGRIAKVLKQKEEDLVELFYDSRIKVSGFALHPKVFLKSKALQFIFVNNRPVSDSTIYKAVVDGYDTFLMKNQYPGFVVFVDLPSDMVDVNVHPRKTEVRFINPGEIYKAVRTSVNVNLTKRVREETLDKLQSSNLPTGQAGFNVQIEEESEVQEIHEEVVQEYKVESSREGVTVEIKEEVKLVSDFEDFLNQGNEEEKSEKPQYVKPVTKQAVLFNKEIISENEDQQSIYLDYVSATQLLDSYIVTSNGKDILIIDQHAASERYFYEKFLNQIKSKKIDSKILLFPEVVTLDSHDIKIIDQFKSVFTELGFDYEIFGDEDLKFTQVPEFIKTDNFSLLIERIIHDILENGEISNVKDKIFHEIAAILACHTAVRFGDKLNKDEIVKVLKNLATCEDPYNCPHGRPVIQEFSKYEIEKKFKRCGL